MKIKINVLFVAIVLFVCMYSVSAMPQFAYIGGTSPIKQTFLPQSVSSIGGLKGAIGEYFTEIDYISRLGDTGWTSINPRNTAQGLDHVFIKFNEDGLIEDVLVAETKFRQASPQSSLGSTNDGWQMSSSWIDARMNRFVIPQYSQSVYLIAESEGNVFLAKRPREDTILKGSRLYIDSKSFYFKKIDGDNAVYFYDGNSRYSTATTRINQVNRTANGLSAYVDSHTYKTRLIRYSYEDGVLSQTIYKTIDNGNAKPFTPISEPVRRFTNSRAKANVALSAGFETDIMNRYAIPDSAFFHKLNTNQRLSLINGVDSNIGNEILSSSINRSVVSNRFGLNSGTNYIRIGLSDSEMDSLFKSTSIDDLNIALANKLKRASRYTTIKNTLGWGAIGIAGGVVSEMLRTGGNIADMNWTVIGLAGGSFATGSLLNRGVEIILQNANSSSKIFQTLGKLSPIGWSIITDALVDSIFTGYYLYTGEYSLSQAVAVTGINIATDAAIILGSSFLRNIIASAIGGSVGGPIGAAVAGILATAASVGTIFIINPITNSIELSSILDSLNSPNSEDMVSLWTLQYLNK